MECPKCKKTLEAFTHEDVEFDFCSEGCHGVWCNKGELAFYIETATDFPFLSAPFKSAETTNLSCVTCSEEKLVEISYHKDHDIKIDVCSKCRGIWLDKKELHQIEELGGKLDARSRIKSVIEHYHKKGYTFL